MEAIGKPWGKEEILANTERYVVKKIYMYKGHRCSLQYHEYKTETIYVLSGALLITKNFIGAKSTWEDIVLYPGDFCTILPGEVHRMEGKEDAIYLEASTTELDDVVRVEDDYGRE